MKVAINTIFEMIYNHGQKNFTFLCEDKYGSIDQNEKVIN